ncbi:proteasome activator complex subunit 2 [Phyllopteryx taeniolatus]|uniref:proteasome activator complex subunit 2 n=1 Tax=Phyllopteryx taeniolatus TaxID=161469 RepID=UPI002AD356D9|nr:proteasome activator complex subunit 2 [Phyllopteryx taeniolatus]
MPQSSVLKISPENAARVQTFHQALLNEANNLFSTAIPSKILQLDALLRDVCVTDMSLKAPLDIPIPDPPASDDEDMENNEEEKKKKKPKCGFIKSHEMIVTLVGKLKPEIVSLRETIISVTSWIQHLIPKIEDGNDFGVAVQEKILERIAAVKTKVDGFQGNINKYFLERGDAVAKASKDTHVMDYRSLVHEKDVAVYSDIRMIVLDLRSFYVELYDMISKNMEKVTNPKGEEKPSMY